MAFIEPCFGIGHNLSLICQMTSEDIKHQLIIIIIIRNHSRDEDKSFLKPAGWLSVACGHGGVGQAPAGVPESQRYRLGICPRNFQWAYQRSICPGLTSSLFKTGQLPLPPFWLFSPSSTNFTLACHMLIRPGNWGICTRLTFGGCLITT